MMTNNGGNGVIAIAGQPNTGKSTLFNALTGLRQAVSNWPGKTVEKKSGAIRCNGGVFEIVDLPGTYSLTAGSTEERIARDYVLEGPVDLVLVVVNALCLERTLYYASEIAALGTPYLLCLNMMDLAEEAGCSVDPVLLQERLGVPVVPLVASRGKGIDNLRTELEKVLSRPLAAGEGPSVSWLGDEMRTVHASLTAVLGNGGGSGGRAAWDALKLMEGDEDVRARLSCSDAGLESADSVLRQHSSLYDRLVADRYDWIRNAVGAMGRKSLSGEERTRRWDRWATHPFWGLWIMLGVLIFGMLAGMLLGLPPALLIMEGVFRIEDLVSRVGAANLPWLGGLLQGIVRGAGSVVSIVPYLAAFHVLFSLLEDVGYMARIAFVMDRFMTRIGLSGRAFIPFLFSLPCNISGAMACRIADSERQRLLTILLVPLVPCSAKIAVSAAIASWLFAPATAVLVVMSLLLLNFLLLGGLCRLFNRFLPGDRAQSSFIMELPPYQKPDWKAVGKHAYARSLAFVRKAGTLIVAFSALVWFAAYFPTGQINTSLLGIAGHWLEPLGRLMGLDWRMVTALFASVLNKEAMLATMAIIFQASPQELPGMVRAVVSPAGAVTFMYAQSVFLPCVATLGTIYSELGKQLKTVLGIVAYTSALSLGVGILVYQLLSLVDSL